MNYNSQILQNAIFIPEKDLYLISGHRHEWTSVTLKDKKTYFIDGGREYIHSGGDLLELESSGRVVLFHLSLECSFTDRIYKMLLWGTRGIKGDQPVKYRPMVEYESDHLKAILRNCPNASPWHRLAIHHILTERGDTNARMVA